MERLVLWHRVVPSVREEDLDPQVEASWVRTVSARLHAAGGVVAGSLGGAVAATFDPTEAHDAIELGLALLQESERASDPSQAPRVALAAAVGDVDALPLGGGAPMHIGAALDRAQLLANRARVGEFVFDTAARDLASPDYLFQRSVGSGEASVRGHAIDRTHPRLSECRASLGLLREAPVPPHLAEVLGLRELATGEGPNLVVIRGLSGAGIRRYLRGLERDVGPRLVLRLPGTPGGVEPLGSLRLGLKRFFGSPERLESSLGDLPASARFDLANVARGTPVPLPAVVDAMTDLLLARSRKTTKPWLLLEPLHAIDVSTLELVAQLASRITTSVLVVVRAFGDTRLPTSLARCPTLREVTAPRLRPEDAKTVAEHVLGSRTGPDVTRRLVSLAGETPLALVELARSLVASGDLVVHGRAFVWRTTPRTSVKALPLEEILGERIASLEPEPMRVLELLAAAPAAIDDALLVRIAALDQLNERELRSAIDRLASEKFLAGGDELGLANEPLRSEVLKRMPPARFAEIHRFLAEAFSVSYAQSGSFGQATLGHFLAEGGHTEEGARLLLEASMMAANVHHGRSAVRLAAAAVQAHPTPDVRDVSAKIMRAVVAETQSAETTRIDTDPGATPIPSEPTSRSIPLLTVGQSAVQALLSRDFERVERCIDLAIAEGGSLAAADRIRAIAALCRGDREAAVSALAKARAQSREADQDRARDELAASWIRIHDGDLHGAVRGSLAALSTARAAHDLPGESAALHTLAVCYRLLGRPSDAEALVTKSLHP